MRAIRLAVGWLAALVCVAGAGAMSSAQVREVTMPGKAYAPDRLQVLVGDTVLWRNADMLTHTVTANDDAFESGRIAPGLTYTHVFSNPGRYAYHCTIHKFMRGVVTVVTAALTPPASPVLSGGVAVLQGLAPDGVDEVLVEQIAPAGPTRRAVPAADGSFGVRARVTVPTVFRARAGAASSPPVRVVVAPRVSAHHTGSSLVATVTPARAGAVALLQTYDRELFGWRTLRRRTVHGSRVSIPLEESARGYFRIVVRGGAGWADGASRAVKVG